MKLLLLLLSFYLVVLCSGWVTIGTAKATTTTTTTSRRRRRVQTTTTTTTTTTLIENILMADLQIIENGTKLQATVTYQGDGFLGFAFSLDKLMKDSFAVIGLPAADGSNTGTVFKYELIGRTTPVLMSTDRQTLTDTSVTSDGSTTILKFTKLLNETGEVIINPNGDNIFLYAVGPDGLPDQLVFHKLYGDVTVNFVTGITAASDPNEYKTLWLCHGILLALAWMILIPIGTACSIARALFPTTTTPHQPVVAYWFQLHRSLNMCGVLLTIVGFAIAVYVIQAEQGDTAQHFTEQSHHKIGLAVMIVAVLNALMGIFRPPAPHPVVAAPSAVAMDDDEDDHDVNNNNNSNNKVATTTTTTLSKTPARVAFEYGHRVFGLAAIIMAWFNVGSGAELIHIKYVNDIKDLSLAAWIIMAIIAVLILILGMVGRNKK